MNEYNSSNMNMSSKLEYSDILETNGLNEDSIRSRNKYLLKLGFK